MAIKFQIKLQLLCLLTITFFCDHSSIAQVSSCLSGSQLTAYTTAVDGDLIEVTEAQYLCVSGLANISEIGSPSSTIINDPNTNTTYSGDFTEICLPSNSEGINVEIPFNKLLIGFLFTNAAGNNLVGPRVGTVNDSIIKPHNNDINVSGVGDKFFIIKNPSALANVTTHLGIHRTGQMYSPYNTNNNYNNYRYDYGASSGMTTMSNCS